MTSYDGSAPASGSSGSGGRRRALGRGPGTSRTGRPAHDDSAWPAPVQEARTTPPAVATEPETGQEAAPDEAGGQETPVGAGAPERAPEPAGEPARPAEEPEAALEGAEEDLEGAEEPEAALAGPETVPEPVAETSPAPVAVATPPSGSDTVPESPEAADGVFKVRLVNFEGPFDLLLQLISRHKLDVTEVALSKVTDEFMAHIRAMGPDWDLDQTTEFLVVAATLLDLKAARLLPAAEVEDEADLALLEARDLLFARLLQYRAYKRIAEIFNGRTEEEARRYPRTVGLEPHHAELLPEVVISIGAEGFARLAVKAMQPKPRPQVYVDHIHAPLVSVQEQAGIVVARLKELGEASFRELVEDTDDTLTVVARFLALLELYREKAVALDQETALGDLVVRWTGGDGDETPVVTDEFDRAPEVPEEERKA
ncbi:segregation/condensation protein A [Streptomyces sp. NPDC052036]|uniref:segregation and condensation protein A n=1 Tax=unclassified Streptomyces TaxID=2593676 RepID=UPI0034233951